MRGTAWNEAFVCGLVVVSHWVLDFVTHRPDMPIAPGDSPHVGLMLWASPVATVVVECALFGAGVWVYNGITRPRNRVGKVALAGLVALLIGLYTGSILGPPPPDVRTVVLVSLVGVPLMLLLPWWVDRNREPAAT
jgi:hypothetical protein